MTSRADWAEIIRLDRERIEIQRRIAIRAAIHHGTMRYRDPESGFTPIDGTVLLLLRGHDPATDGKRYVEIQDRQWQILLGRDIDPGNTHEVPPS